MPNFHLEILFFLFDLTLSKLTAAADSKPANQISCLEEGTQQPPRRGENSFYLKPLLVKSGTAGFKINPVLKNII